VSAFDPFTATLEEAQAQPDANEPRGAVWRACGAHMLMERRAYYEANPLDGMAVCAVHDLVAPDWLARAYLRGFRTVVNCEARSWDEAFGAPFPKGTNIAAARRARRNRVAVAVAFSDILQRDPSRPVDKALWEEIGARIGEGATRAEELYREALRMGAGLTAEQVRGPLRPAKSRKLAGVRRRR